jgi:hypothetical protein
MKYEKSTNQIFFEKRLFVENLRFSMNLNFYRSKNFAINYQDTIFFK